MDVAEGCEKTLRGDNSSIEPDLRMRTWRKMNWIGP